MSNSGQAKAERPEEKWSPIWLRALQNPKFRALSARLPIVRNFVKADQTRVFDVMSGFVYSQILNAAVEVDLFHQLQSGPKSPHQIAGLSTDAARLLCRGAAGLGLVKERRDGRYQLTRHGAVIEAVPGLKTMIRHHSVLYRDLQNPVAVLEGQSETEMSGFWPYVFGASEREVSQDEASLYSQVMSDTQSLVAEQVLAHVSFSGVQRLLDVGGGQGVFVKLLQAKYPTLDLALFDLPTVVEPSGSFETYPGNFRTENLPSGFDTISLIRILFDHQNLTVVDLLQKVFTALPDGGRVIVAEPMAGGAAPTREGDAYYALYTRSMRTGQTRRPQDIAALLSNAGFERIRIYPDQAPAVARVIEASKAI
ncbi:MAG: methyltransferase [Pseudomonadota bacterium]